MSDDPITVLRELVDAVERSWSMPTPPVRAALARARALVEAQNDATDGSPTLCSNCDETIDRCDASHGEYGFTCLLPSGHPWPHFDDAGGYWGSSGQVGLAAGGDHPDLIDRDGDRWTWTGTGYVVPHPGLPLKVVTQNFGPLTHTTAPEEASDAG